MMLVNNSSGKQIKVTADVGLKIYACMKKVIVTFVAFGISGTPSTYKREAPFTQINITLLRLL